ncbi:MAG: electron transfer flavoprotein subunit alpha/FixB family protein [bacterium JZ-2024 1]
MRVVGWVEFEDGVLSGASASVLTLGRHLAKKSGGAFWTFIAVPEDQADSAVRAVSGYDATGVALWKGAEGDLLNTSALSSALVNAVRKASADVVLVPDSVTGREVGSRTAQALSAGFVNRIASLEYQDETIRFTKPNFGGKYRVQGFAKTLPCVFALPSGMGQTPGEARDLEVIEVLPDPETLGAVALVERAPAEKVTVRLEEAGVIVSGGRGLGKPEGFALIREVAHLIGAEVGASRAVVDSGWIPYAHQVGQTGKTVKPKVYIACGISGAVQHRAGMQGSEFIIAINKDKSAPIFQIADLGAVGDLYAILPKVIEKIKERGLAPRR